MNKEMDIIMIYMRLMGGLGNQMFQYAYLCMFIKKFPDEDITIDLSSYKKDKLRDFSLGHFRINRNWSYRDVEKEISDRFRGRFFIRKCLDVLMWRADHTKDNYENCTLLYNIKHSLLNAMGIYCHYFSRYRKPVKSFFPSKYIVGMWHSHALIDEVIKDVKKEFVLDEFIGEKNEIIREKIEATNSVCVHVRRGDYLELPKYWVCDEEYYFQAIHKAQELLDEPMFYFFSDDIEWAKEKFGSAGNMFYVDEGNPDYIDFALMSSSRHFIISNSTYSWWASMCGDYAGKKVFAPDKWYADNETKECIYLDDWYLIPSRVTRMRSF